MTTKEIAEVVGRAEKTVRTWAAKAAAKSAEAAAKSAEATPSHPADWTLRVYFNTTSQGGVYGHSVHLHKCAEWAKINCARKYFLGHNDF